jgi:hypothetical protein
MKKVESMPYQSGLNPGLHEDIFFYYKETRLHKIIKRYSDKNRPFNYSRSDLLEKYQLLRAKTILCV